MRFAISAILPGSIGVWGVSPTRPQMKTYMGIRMSARLHKIWALTVLIVAGVIGGASFLSFLVFLYAGSFNWIRLNFSEIEKLLFNGGLCLFFFLQHSGMVRRSFQNRLSRHVAAHYHGAMYTVASGISLFVFVTFWQDSNVILVQADGLLRHLLRMLFFLPIVGILWGLRAIRSADMFGLDPILKDISGNPVKKCPFTVRGPYRWVRHPLYLFMILQFWSYPILTVDRLFFNIMWTLWVIVATTLEEKDLAEDFGDMYRDYQAKVPMLLPKGIRASYPP